MNRTLILGLVLLAGGCANPMTLTYDFGRAFNTATQMQADLTRPSVAAAQYRLSGLEGTDIRLQLRETTGEAKDMEIELEYVE